MTFIDFMCQHPFITLFMAWSLFYSVRTMWKLFWRRLNIRKHGWPPAHCDADGDFKSDD